MRDLNFELQQICRRNPEGTRATQAERENVLDLCADQLHEMGIKKLRVHGFKPKHVSKLVARWLAEGLTPGTLKNRLSHLRWLARKLGKANVVAASNAAYGIPGRG